MNTSKRRYDGKHRVTRILLADYLALKRISQAAGVSMAEALHKILTKQIGPESVTKPVTEPAYRVVPTQAYRVVPAQAYRVVPVTAIATNGSKAAAFRIKTKGVKYD